MPLTLKVFKHVAGGTEYAGEHVLEQDIVTIGRSKQCTLSLDDPQRLLSRVHAELVRTATGCKLNVVSTNYPVTVNGRDYEPGSVVLLHPGDSLKMDVYEIEIVDIADADPEATVVSVMPKKAPAARPPETRPQIRPAPRTESRPESRSLAVPPAPMPSAESRVPQHAVKAVATPLAKAPEIPPVAIPVAKTGGSRGKFIGIGAAAIVVALAVFLAGPKMLGGFGDRDAEMKADQEIARLDAESRALLKLVERDRQEMKDAVAGANREIERLAAQIASSRAGAERQTLEAAHLEAIETARLNSKLERSLREHAEGPTGLPKAEGNLSAAAVALKNGDRTEALKLQKETVAALTQIRSAYATDRKTMLAEQLRRKESLNVAESNARAQTELRAKAEREAQAKADAEKARIKAANAARDAKEAEALAKANAEARLRETEARVRAETEARVKAEVEAKVRTESEARAKAESDARAKADAEARARAQDEARARAEALARAQEQAQARAEAAERAREAAAERQRAAAEARERAETQRQTVESIINIFGRIAR